MDIECEVRNHSRRQLEIKTQFPIPVGKRSKYTLDLFLFTPGQLNIDKKNYGLSQFFKDYKSNVRYSSPQIPLSGLVNSECKPSPLYRIDKKLKELNKYANLDEDYILYELRVLTNIYRLEIKSVTTLIIREICNGNQMDVVSTRLLNYLSDIKLVLDKLRSLYLTFMTPGISEKLKTALSWADESMSMLTHNSLLKIYDYTDSIQDIKASLVELVESEINYRNSKGFISSNESGRVNQGQTISYRESILKKWSQGALYMNLEKSKANKQVGHILSSIAASFAMAFAVAATFLAEKLFTNYSTPWILVAIMIYMFKDRIKDILKSIFFKFLPLFIADLISNLIDPASNKRVGKCKTMVRFCDFSSLPHDIASLRDRRKNPFKSILPAENIINCKKITIINNKELLKNHTRHNSITEITRLNVENWLKDMDDPTETLSTLENGKKIRIEGSRVYYMHLIVSVNNKLFHYRIVLNRVGIIKVELM